MILVRAFECLVPPYADRFVKPFFLKKLVDLLEYLMKSYGAVHFQTRGSEHKLAISRTSCGRFRVY